MSEELEKRQERVIKAFDLIQSEIKEYKKLSWEELDENKIMGNIGTIVSNFLSGTPEEEPAEENVLEIPKVIEEEVEPAVEEEVVVEEKKPEVKISMEDEIEDEDEDDDEYDNEDEE